MLAGRNLRQIGSNVSYSRQRLLRSSLQARQFSLNTVTKISHPSFSPTSSFRQQVRSLSLFGWGSAQKSEVGKLQTTTEAPPDVEIGNSSLSDVRSFKASHATSDAPDPTIGHHQISNFEPEIIEKVQELVTLPDQVTTIANGQVDIASIPERIGYLKEVCGLDYGWGPTALVEWCLEQLHITGGLSWATSIIIIAAITRIILVKPTINAQKESAKLKDLNPIIAPMREKANQYLKEGNRQKQLEVSSQMRAIYKEYDVKFSRVFMPMLVQLPIQFGAFRLLAAAGRLPVPAFVNESWLWNTDLSFSDPYYITPALSALFMWSQIKLQARTQTAGGPMSPEVMKLIGNILPVASFVFMCMQPGAVQLYFMTTSLFALMTGETLRQDSIRRILRLPLLHTTPNLNSTSTPAAASPAIAGKNAETNATSMNGLQVRRQPVVAASPPAETVSNQSGIDKFVDGVKQKGFGKNWKAVTDKLKTSKEDLNKEQNQKYEVERSRQLDIEREVRNQAARERMQRKL